MRSSDLARSKRKKHVTLTLTDEEHKVLQDIAKADKRPISSEVMYLADRRAKELKR